MEVSGFSAAVMEERSEEETFGSEGEADLERGRVVLRGRVAGVEERRGRAQRRRARRGDMVN